MKKLFAVAVLSLVAVTSWGQGQVTFVNGGVTFATAADRFVYLTSVGGTKLTGTNYVAGLWFGTPSGGLDAPASGGLFAGRTVAFRPGTTLTPGLWGTPSSKVDLSNNGVIGVQAGGATSLQVRVWDAAKFSSYDAAVAGGGIVGASSAFAYTAPDPSIPGTSPSAYYMEGLRAFAVNPVPEPSTIALGVLGVAGLLALRRRK